MGSVRPLKAPIQNRLSPEELILPLAALRWVHIHNRVSPKVSMRAAVSREAAANNLEKDIM